MEMQDSILVPPEELVIEILLKLPELFLWNPSIRKYKKLPDPRTSLPPQGGPRRAYGFGYDEVHDDYKSENDSWRCVDDCPRMAQFNVSEMGRDGEIALRVGVLGSDLSVLCNCNMLLVDVWVMKEYGDKEYWTKMFTIKYTPRSGYLGQRCLHMSNEGEILVVIKGEFMIYNPKDDSLRYSQVIINFDKWDGNEIYVESLVCP
ncbi:hypothetical protein H5410_048980 [Solanum commersonii]|uniref:F-box family protein n=1 Tax=Solanum commersonii TaxID=4109 RepID=A0A9J5XLA0_SOLCO|nr:hypothetical protein H5410_048980 [Solanum commersonii]